MRSTFMGVALVLGLASSSPAVIIPVLNSDFETFYKGTGNTVTGTFNGGANTAWTGGVGPGVSITNCCGLVTTNNVTWSDSTQGNVGDPVNVPGWLSTNGFSGGLQHVIGEGGSNGIFVNGPNFGDPGSLITSTSSIGTIQAGLTYTLSISVSDQNGGNAALPVSLDLLDPSNNVIPSSSSVSPVVSPTYQIYSRTYAAADLLPYVGDAIKIRFGGGNTSGSQTDYDNVSLTAAVPEPSSLVLCALSALGLFVVARLRRKA